MALVGRGARAGQRSIRLSQVRRPHGRHQRRPGAQANAAFLGTDTTTEGNWKGTYGTSGFDVSQDPTLVNNPTLPSYASVSVNGNLTWTTATSDPRGLLESAPGSTNRVAGVWVSPTRFSINLTLTDGQSLSPGSLCGGLGRLWRRTERTDRRHRRRYGHDALDSRTLMHLRERRIPGVERDWQRHDRGDQSQPELQRPH